MKRRFPKLLLVRGLALVVALCSGWLLAHHFALSAARAAQPVPAPQAPPATPRPPSPISAPRPALRQPPPAPAPVPNPVALRPPGWRVLEEAAAFSGLCNVFLSVPSGAPLTCGPRRRATLFLRCLEDRTAAYVAHDCQTPGGAEGWPVGLRLDAGEPRVAMLDVDRRGEAFGHWDYRGAREFIESLLGAERLHLRFTDGSGTTERVTFPVADLAAPLARLAAACHWSEVPPWAAASDAPGGPQAAADPRPGP
ncbi:hypothetical protein [Jannaschia ovalis]|uniref:Type VI secretion system VasI, EvfG, VC_A0118 n=1 Tax=Jannaschia ovalis TaxID=3038773 RepID=A0ABY8LDH3_9RHOB|nr:hypothetical protein [Jannaschia sp. GRR-S6-38]WGH79369.1 hypothetical protein P8627_03635 [Jannaschia sp. GRR-S6-38]